MNTKQVIVIRKDLKMRRGKEIAQGAHASMAVLTRRLHWDDINSRYIIDLSEEIEEWLESSFRKITVVVNSEEELLEIYHKASNRGIDTALITDNGVTEFNGVKTITCCAVGPAEDKVVDEITGHLKLY